MHTGGTHHDGDGDGEDGAGKVVRIPRDWFGPHEELVPFGPRAPQTSPTRPPAEASPLDPNTFWDEGSSSIQDVVEAPAGAAAAPQPAGERDAAAGLLGSSRRPGGCRAAVAGRPWAVAALIGVMLVSGGALLGWLLASPQPHVYRAAVTGTKNRSGPLLTGQPRNMAESRLAEHQLVARPNRAVVHKLTREASARRSAATSVAYRSSLPITSAPLQSSYQPPTASSSTTRAITNGGGISSATAAPAAAEQSSPPAFGANGALGPMSSPNG